MGSSSISTGIPCGPSYGCDLKPVICSAEQRSFQVAQVRCFVLFRKPDYVG